MEVDGEQVNGVASADINDQLISDSTIITTTPTIASQRWDDFSLEQAVYVFLQQTGILPSSSIPRQSELNRENHSHLEWQPLLPDADVALLFSTIPPSLVPADFANKLNPSSASGSEKRRKLLDTLARLALEPALTLVIGREFRPLAPHLWGRWLDMLGLDSAGEWPVRDAGSQVDGEKEAVERVYRAMVKTLSVFDFIFPFLTTLLRHPLLASPPLPPPTCSQHELATPLLTFHSLLNSLPHLPSSTHTMTPTSLPWSLPPSVETVLKTHPHRGTRLLAWRIVRKWHALFGAAGEDLREKWVWAPNELAGDTPGQSAPTPPYDTTYEAEYTQALGEFAGESSESDIVRGWDIRLDGEARAVQGGVEVAVRSQGVDVWVLPAVEDARIQEEFTELSRCQSVSQVDLLSDEAKQAFESSTPSSLGFVVETELASSVVNVEGHLIFREGFIPSTNYISLSSNASSHLTSASTPSTNQPKPELFVVTPSTSALLRSVALHLRRRIPMLITSPPSSGKTSTLTHAWSLLHAQPGQSRPTPQARQRGLVFINLADRSLDSKSLLGSLSSAPATNDSEAGTFAFVEGPLTRAVRQGRWVVLTSIDQASLEVLTVIKVLLERMHRASESSAGGAWGGGPAEEAGGVGVRVGSRFVPAGRGFMLFATRSVDTQAEAVFFGSHFFSEVWMERPAVEEIRTIVEGRYVRLGRAGLAPTMIDVFEKARDAGTRESTSGTARILGVRDLMRWCRRVEELFPSDVVINSIESNPTLQEEIFTEARDVFLGSLPVPPQTTSLAEARDRYSVVGKVLAEGLGLSLERAEYIIRRRVPELVVPRLDESDGRVSKAVLQLHIGRVALPFQPSARIASSRPYALTKPSLVVLEKLAVALRLSEPVLMVGETGTGKTAAVGHLADLLGKNLTALNLSNQTEAGDLVGGFRPIDEAEEARRTAAYLVNRFVELFGQTFSLSRNADYVSHVKKAFEKKRWPRLVGLWREAFRMASERLAVAGRPVVLQDDAPRKRRKVEAISVEDLPSLWDRFLSSVADFDVRHVQKAGKSKFVFSFVEGPLAKAIRNGDWVLLDEVNLASAETLESLSTLLQAPDSSLILTEQGDLEPIPRHPEFRLFACMNPATDVGKRDLPIGLRAKFSEIWVPPPDEDRDALVTIVQGYIGRAAIQDRAVILDVAELYSAVKALAMGAQLADGSNHPPHFSMRTLARALTFGAEFAPVFGLRRALYEGFLMAFTMLLDVKSNALVRALLEQHIVAKAKNRGSLFAQIPAKPAGAEYIRFGPYWLATGSEALQEPKDYILTPSVQAKVLDLARAILTRKVPVLIQGPTSAGKTSVVEYLAKRTGHRFVRINNHEHTDIQEYIGTYVSDPDSGKLVFQEGILVRALRRGDWIVLDELNLAPTDVLEALNRLLDDNRELVIPETGEVVRPHPHFMLFATQNPPGLYGGRKVLSRAFRNRFLEMHFGDVPQDELETILCQRCEIAPSYAKKTVAVFLELQRRRQAGRVFEQKQAFATLRDLFRWGGRGAVGYQQLAEDGYMLLAERARRADDKAVVKDVIEQEMKVQIDEASLYDLAKLAEAGLPIPPSDDTLVWTSAMRRLYFLIAAGLLRNEPVLLVGETGSGKTSVCQAVAMALHRQLHVVGCHQNTETADLLGGQRPFRNRAALQASLLVECHATLASLGLPTTPDFDESLAAIESVLASSASSAVSVADFDTDRVRDVVERMRKSTALFEWHDGPLVQAMRSGDLVLLDEISLADDSVLERLNSVLEPSRTLVLAEKGGRDLDDIHMVGSDGFQILATMNPGGDFGKKELSPALRNRFTEIWVPHVDDPADLLQIIGSRWSSPNLVQFGPKILEFGRWFREAANAEGPGLGLRDILAWVDFLNVAALRFTNLPSSSPSLSLAEAFCHGALMTAVDGLGALPATSGLSTDALKRLRLACHRQLEELVSSVGSCDTGNPDVVNIGSRFYVGSFGVQQGPEPVEASLGYTLLAPTTRLNAMRVLRALQLPKPILLEGSPGVGKTSLVTALAAATGHHLVRINLSDQTDLMDLLGSDLPVEGGRSGEFAWKDAPFLAAMQHGSWVLLDEMNLASQSVLEGLNSSLDHRGTVYIPELDRTFARHPDFRIFAAQNPLGQGGGRKGLPRSFLDRFSVVHMEELDSQDLQAIASALFPEIEPPALEKMITFNSTVHHLTMDSRSFGAEGSPWEFNLRDVLRWLSLIRTSSGLDMFRGEAVEYAGLLYLQRFRNAKDREAVARLFSDVFGQAIDPYTQPWPSITSRLAQVGHTVTSRSDHNSSGRLTMSAPLHQKTMQALEALAKCAEMGWLAILTGPRASGKTTLVRQLAAFGGHVLSEFSMNAEVDTLELLGSFEQSERFRELDHIALDIILALEHAARANLATPASGSSASAIITSLRQVRTALAVITTDFDVAEATTLLSEGLEVLVSFGSSAATDSLRARLQAGVTLVSTSARFEWLDGPLIQAMKAGHWLLIEDANLCSPSVLDRLNSLFEPGGRLQLAERGPVNGEIQVIVPHANFRLFMTLDPRHGELSRAMRNRGIEIALLGSSWDDFAKPTLPDSSHLSALPPLVARTFEEPGLSSIRRATASLPEDIATSAQAFTASVSTIHQGLALRSLPAFTSLNLSALDWVLRSVHRLPFTKHVDDFRQRQAHARGVPLSLLRMHPLDLALVPQVDAEEASCRVVGAFSESLDSLFALLSSISRSPATVRGLAARPTKTLSVWEKSALAAAGRLRLEEEEPVVHSLAPVTAALGSLVETLTGSDWSSLSGDECNALGRRIKSTQSLAAELETVSSTQAVDFSSIQHVSAWIAEVLDQLPPALTVQVKEALLPLQSSLVLTSGKAMGAIWRSSLHFRPASGHLQDAYTSLVARATAIVGQAWDPAISALFLEIATTLASPGLASSGIDEAELVRLVGSLLARLPQFSASPAAGIPSDLGLPVASDSASFLTAELASIASAFDVNRPPGTWVRIAGKTGIVALTTTLPLLQLAAWPRGTAALAEARPSKMPVEFAALQGWTERLALGLAVVDTDDQEIWRFSTADVVRPVLLKVILSMQSSDASTLGNLVTLAAALKQAAFVQTLAATGTQSRLDSLRAALLASVTLITHAADEIETPDRLLAADRPEALSPATTEALEKYVSPWLPNFLATESTLQSLGEGFVGFGRMLWHLYVPNLPLDPAIGLRARANYVERQLSALTQLIAAHQELESRSTGNDSNAKLDYARAELDLLRRDLATSATVPVARESNPELLAGLFLELRSFQNQVIGDEQLESLLGAMRASWTPGVVSREDNLQHSVKTLLRRLDLAYSSLSDIVAPIRLALCAVKIGFSLVLQAARCNNTTSETHQFAALLTELTSFPTVAHLPILKHVDLPLSIQPGEAPLPPSSATLLQVAAFVSGAPSHRDLTGEDLKRVVQLYDRMHYLWSVDRRRAEEEAQEAASLYKSKVDIAQIATDEEAEAAEFAKMFPTFEDEEDSPSNNLLAPTHQASTGSSRPRLLRLADQATLAGLHDSLFQSETREAAQSHTFDTMRSAAVVALLPTLFETLGEHVDRDSASYRVKTLVQMSQFLSPTSSIATNERDFYTEPDVKETAKAVPVLQGLVDRLSILIEQWPDQMVLQNLRDRCRTTLSLSSKSPIAQVLTALEQLLTHTEDWESYASREHSLSIHRTAITNLIVEWRRLELTCWSRLLSTVQSRFGDPVTEWWFRFYEVTIRGAPGVDEDPENPSSQSPGEYYRDLVSLLDTFMSSSSVGQYSTRLRMLVSFSNFAADLGFNAEFVGASSLSTVSQLMRNVHAFYDQFSPKVSAFLASERSRIDRDVQNLIKLASWKDVNVYALRQSAIRSHHQLYKSVRKLRAVLQKPASDFFNHAPAEQGPSPTYVPPAIPVVDLVAALPSLPSDLVSSSTAAHLLRLDQTLARLASIVSTTVAPFLATDRAGAVDDFVVQIITTAAALRTESLGAEEGREQRVKSLVTRKRRAWIELLRELKRIGLSPSPAPSVVLRLADSGYVYSLPASTELLSLDSVLLSPDRRGQIARSDDYHFRLLSELPEVRKAPANHHQDVSTREIQRAIGSIESCIALGFENRTRLLTGAASQLDLDVLINRLEAAAQSSTPQPGTSAKLLASALLHTVSCTLEGLREAEAAVTSHLAAMASEAAAELDVREVSSMIQESSTLLAGDKHSLRDVLEGLASVNPSITLPSEQAAFEVAHRHLTDVVRQFTEAKWPASIQYFATPLSSWMATLRIPEIAAAAHTDDAPLDVAQLVEAHEALISSVLVVVQDIRKLSTAPKDENEQEDLPDSSIKIDARSMQEVLVALRLPDLLRQTSTLALLAHRASTSADELAFVSTLLRRTVPFVRQYALLVEQHLASFFEWHKTSLKLAHVLCSILRELCEKGFCRPSDDDGSGGEDDANGKTTDGTGMADGKGAKNVSDEIEDESQVEGLQADVEKNEQEQQEEQEGDDNAIEMSADFEGDLEDRGDGDKEDKEDGSEDEDDDDQPEPEEQIADVDPLDPSSVDEKFWGDESKEDKVNEEVNQETTETGGESEMGAKDEAEQPPPKKEKPDGGADAEQDQDVPKDAAEASGEGQEEDGDKEDGDEEGQDGEEAQEGEGEEEEGDAEPHADDGQRLDERMPEADNLDLPDDLQLDGEEKQEDNELDLGDDMDPLLGEEDEGDAGPPQDLDSPEGDPNSNPDDGDILPSEAQPEGPEAIPDEAVPMDQSAGGVDEGETGGEGAQDSSASAKSKDQPQPSEPSAAADDQPKEKRSASEAQEDETFNDADLDDVNDDAEMGNDDDATAPSAPSKSAQSQSKQRSSNADPKSDQRSQQPSTPQLERSLGDALQSWRNRLEAIADMTDPEAQADDFDPSAPGDEAEVEYVPEGHEKEQDGQALGPARDEQVSALEKLSIDEEQPAQDFEPDTMDLDQASSTAPPPTSTTIDIGAGSSMAESEVKAIPAAELLQDRSQAAEDAYDTDRDRDDDVGATSSTVAEPLEDAQVEQAMLQWRSGDDPAMGADDVWRLYESLTRDLSYTLTEQLRLILEPTLATRLKGDYRSGKRLNMKKIIPYIASEFTKDKIWLRRTRPSQREYQILIAIDDSKSMADSHSVHLAYQSLALITRALMRLEVGGVSICRFGDSMDVLHAFDAGPVSDAAGAALIKQFTFAQRTTDVRLLVEKSLAHLAQAKDAAQSGKSSLAAGDLWQLQIIISDGMCQDHEKLRALLRRAAEQKVMFVFLVIDSLHRRTTDGPDSSLATPDVNQNSILAMKSVSYSKGASGQLELKMDRYLDSFPFEYFVVLRQAEALPDSVASVLRQFMERVSAQ